MHTRTPGRSHLRASLPTLLLTLLLFTIAAAPALAKSGRVGPEATTTWKPGALPAKLAQAASTWYGIYDAQPTGLVTRAMTGSGITLTGTDATGAPVWTTTTGDAWAASGRLPAALVATFPNGDPNVLRDGELRAYNANGSTRFRKVFKHRFVQPLADTSRRLVWVETSGKAVTRIFVRQGAATSTVALPYVPSKAHFPIVAAASADGSRVVVGISKIINNKRSVMTYWLRVSKSGVPSLVSHGVTDWVSASLTPHGDRAAVLTSDGLGDGPNWWVKFGAFRGRMLPGNDAGMMDVSGSRIFQQGGYWYGGETTAWGATTVEVFEQQSLYALYKRTWTFDDAESSIWFRHDGEITRLAGVDSKGVLTAINVDNWAITSVPGTYSDAVPIDGGRVATMTPDGTLAFIADPVPGP